MLFLILSSLTYGLADEAIVERAELVSHDAINLETMEDDLIDEAEAESETEELSDEDVSTIEDLGDNSIEEAVDVDEADASPLEKLLGDKFSEEEDIQTIEPVTEESEDEGILLNHCNKAYFQ